jgi:hypothetical protein
MTGTTQVLMSGAILKCQILRRSSAGSCGKMVKVEVGYRSVKCLNGLRGLSGNGAIVLAKKELCWRRGF